MIDQRHLHNLEQAYLADHAHPDRVDTLVVGAGSVRLTVKMGDEDRRPDGALKQGTVYDTLHDAAQLAAASLTEDLTLTTDEFVLSPMNDLSAELLTARAQVTTFKRDRIVVAASLTDEHGRTLATARGVFRLHDEEDLEDLTQDLSTEDRSPITQVVWMTPFGPIFPN
ncbi:MAG: hypothetical protein D6685_03910 [Bacteroidetes bacterium]|nr:hypothetical protein AWN76_007695 [Rhodothermaceae bacterium RA]RMH67221.1 MAG: hypothetical protein D6685_03910 [Bacteroidota bacterium]